jgi:polyvinyl alcohol dehydrogenase (cytochrome)
MRSALFVGVGILVASSVGAQTPDGAAVFEKACASCHAKPAPDSRAPTREVLRNVAPEAILTTLTVGNMFRQGSELTDAERRAVAGFLAGRPVGTAAPPSIVGRCQATPPPLQLSMVDAGWNGWGAGAANTRFQPAAKAKLDATSVPKLKLKWAYGFAGVNSARSQPAVLGGRLFVASESGDVVALDAKRGCTYWTYHAQAGIRTAVSVGPYQSANANGRGLSAGFAVYFSDGSATAYAVDATTGKEIWHRKVDDHPYARATGSLTLYQNRVYVPTAGVGEEGQGGLPRYECCTFRGSVTALNASTGAVIWKSYTISEEPKPRAKNAAGVQTWGPAGGGVWGAPTVDAARRAIYITTGNNYSGPVTPTSDAIIAMDLETGKIRWSFQPTTNDVWTGGCRPTNPADSNCPAALGPDHDFSISPLLTKGPNGRDVIIALQKSGMAYAVDPDTGTKVWEYKTSEGSGMGGQWGIAADDTQVYFGVNGPRQAPGGMRATTIATGQEVWSKPAAERLCGTARGCSAAQGAALTTIPGLVFSGSQDGGVRAYSAKDGSIVWQFDTNKEFETVNGVTANGGAIDGPGPVVADGMVYVTSGYVSLIGRPGNVLLAFGVD